RALDRCRRSTGARPTTGGHGSAAKPTGDVMQGLRKQQLLKAQCFINGEWVAADSGQTITVKNPATGEAIGTVPRMGRAETKRAVEMAEKAWASWRSKLAKERSVILRKWFELMMANQDDLALIMTSEQGKPMTESRGEIAYAASFIEWFAEEGKRAYGDVIPTFRGDSRVVVIKQPV